MSPRCDWSWIGATRCLHTAGTVTGGAHPQGHMGAPQPGVSRGAWWDRQAAFTRTRPRRALPHPLSPNAPEVPGGHPVGSVSPPMSLPSTAQSTARHMAWHGMAWHRTAQNGMAQHRMAWHRMAQHGTAQHGTGWRGTTRQDTGHSCRALELLRLGWSWRCSWGEQGPGQGGAGPPQRIPHVLSAPLGTAQARPWLGREDAGQTGAKNRAGLGAGGGGRMGLPLRRLFFLPPSHCHAARRGTALALRQVGASPRTLGLPERGLGRGPLLSCLLPAPGSPPQAPAHSASPACCGAEPAQLVASPAPKVGLEPCNDRSGELGLGRHPPAAGAWGPQTLWPRPAGRRPG